MPETEQNLPKTPNEEVVKDTKYGLWGIFIGLLFVVIILGVLDSLKIINLFPNKNNSLNLSGQTPKEKIVNPVLASEAKKAGYSIVWGGNIADTTGRTVLASSQRTYENYKDVFGWSQADFGGHSDFGRGVGIFKEWQAISGSKDFYVVLENPLTQQEFTARILVEKSDLSSPFEDKQLMGGNRTRLEVENLNITDPKSSKMFQRIGFFYNLDIKIINEIIKPGDVVAVYTIPLSSSEIKSSSDTFIKMDKNSVPAIVSLTIRRFGGKSEIDKELKL